MYYERRNVKASCFPINIKTFILIFYYYSFVFNLDGLISIGDNLTFNTLGGGVGLNGSIERGT